MYLVEFKIVHMQSRCDLAIAIDSALCAWHYSVRHSMRHTHTSSASSREPVVDSFCPGDVSIASAASCSKHSATSSHPSNYCLEAWIKQDSDAIAVRSWKVSAPALWHVIERLLLVCFAESQDPHLLPAPRVAHCRQKVHPRPSWP